jgi:hypothetical protein
MTQEATPDLGWLDDVAGRAQAELDQMQARRDELMAQVAAVDVQMKKVRQIVRVVHPEEAAAAATAKKKHQSGGSTKPTALGNPKLKMLVDAILETYGDEPFNPMDLHRDVLNNPWSEPHTYTMMKTLRKIEFVGKAGTEPQVGGRGSGRTLWRVLDRDAYANALAAQNGVNVGA